MQQVLFGVLLRVELVELQLRREGRAELAESLGEAEAWVKRALQVARHLAVDLSPPALKEEDLGHALEWLKRQARELHGLEVGVEPRGAVEVRDEGLRVLLFQVVRELLFNVTKHAGVRQATVELGVEDGEAWLRVADGGRGFSWEEVKGRDPAVGFGLYSIHERIAALGGRVEVDSAPGAGARVVVRVPLEGARDR